MKSIYLLTTFIFISVVATAQNNPSIVDLSSALNKPQPQLIATTSLGKVYAMAPDNMPCLVPFAATEGGNMPNLKTPLYQNDMPNATPQQQLQQSSKMMKKRLQLNLPSTTDNTNLMFELLGK